MPSNFGTTPLSTTPLGSNQFPISAGFVPNTASGNLTSIQLGPSSTDSNLYTSAPIATYTPDGNSLVEGVTTDAAVIGDVAGSLSAKLRGLSKIFAQLQFDGSNFLKVNIAAGTVAATQSGAWNITNILGTIALPTGAATSAKQPALGTAGSASSDVITVQGIASMTALKVDGSAVTQPISGTITANIGTTNGLALDTSVNGILLSQGSTTSGQKGPLAQGAVTTSSPSYTTAQSSPLSLTTAGALRVDGSAVTQPVSVQNGNANGQAPMVNSSPVVFASDQSKLPTKASSGDFVDGSIVTLGTEADAAASSDSATATYMSHFKRLQAKLPTIGQQAKTNSLSVTIASDQWTASNAAIVEQNIINWIRNGNGFIGTCGNLITATNANLNVCTLSLFNPSNSGKNVLIYSIRLGVQNSATGSSKINLTTTDPSGSAGHTNVLTPTNSKVSGGNSTTISLSSSANSISTSVTPAGNTLDAFAVSGNAPAELLNNGATVLLPNGSANGIAIYTFVSTAGNAFMCTARWIEY